VSTIQLGTGSVLFAVDDRMAAMVDRVVREAIPGVVERIERAAQELHDDAKAKWPVGPDKPWRREGHSRDHLSWMVTVDPATGTITGRVRNTASWARFIKPKGLAGKTAMVVYLRVPLAKMKPSLIADVRNLLKDTIEGGG
jgi:hypothetical protein